jgi:hypothetical protein
MKKVKAYVTPKTEEEALARIKVIVDNRARHDAGEIVEGFNFGSSTQDLLRLKRNLPRLRKRKA